MTKLEVRRTDTCAQCNALLLTETQINQQDEVKLATVGLAKYHFDCLDAASTGSVEANEYTFPGDVTVLTDGADDADDERSAPPSPSIKRRESGEEQEGGSAEQAEGGPPSAAPTATQAALEQARGALGELQRDPVAAIRRHPAVAGAAAAAFVGLALAFSGQAPFSWSAR